MFVVAMSACTACAANPPIKRPLDQQNFEAAKAKCGATEATYFSGGFGFTLAPGQDSPTEEQKAKLDCMGRELATFDYHVVSEVPPPQ